VSQAEAAALMGVTERTVRRYWTAARLKLYRGLKGRIPLDAGAVPGEPP
jgi:DNA-directed RNA polymerase specialized sigma24 family protein